ncbi:MAG TPA: hypothetical protein ENK25_10735 [Bacteroidetes bacterium]|nr:hypothetical protein [Bacteroidota bacterium]
MVKDKKKPEKSYVRHLTKIAGGTSYALVIPMDYIRDLGWKDRQKLVVRKYGKRLSIQDWKPED